METIADPLLEEYLRVCYGYDNFHKPSAQPMNPEEEEFAESDAYLKCSEGDEEHRTLLEQKLRGLAPLSSTTTGGLSMQTFVRSSGSKPLFATEVGVAAGEEACGLWKPACGHWPKTMIFRADANIERQAGTLWPSSLKLASLLLRDEAVAEPFLREGVRIIELGSGVGFLVAIVALMGCRHVIATDHPSCQLLALENIGTIAPSISHTVSSLALDWTEPLPAEVANGCPWDIVLCSDLLPYTSMHVALCQKLVELTRARKAGDHCKDSMVLMAYEVRQPRQEEGFFKLASEHFHVEAVSSPLLVDLDADDWRLFRLRPLQGQT